MKGPDAFRTISEVADDLDLPQHVLRFWETRFGQIKPMKRGGGRRYYRPDDVDLLRGIRLLLYGEGFTIKGVQRLLKEKGAGFVIAAGQTGSVQTVTKADAAEVDAPPMPNGAAEPTSGFETSFAADDEDRSDDPGELSPSRLQLGGDGRRLLENALSELLEAKRLLDQAR